MVFEPYLFVDLKTPYLAKSTDWWNDKVGEEGINCQVSCYGLEKSNLSDERVLISPKGREVLLKNETTNLRKTAERGEFGMAIPDLYIVGATREDENAICTVRDSGLLVARFSIFYGGENGYTGRTPQEAGYALDIPKSVETVRKLLTHDGCLEAIASRNASKIRESLDELNRGLEKPVLATPHLEFALARPQARYILI